MYGRVSWFSLVFVFIVVLWIGFMLGYLIAKEVYDPRFFTYFNYALGFGFYNALYISFFSVALFEFVCVFLLPIYLNTTFFVFFAIVVIVQMNDWVFVRTTFLGGTNRTIGENHTGDWILHYLPAVFLLAVLISIQAFFVEYLSRYWKARRKAGRVFYLLYLFLTPLLILLLYLITMPFDENYPTSLKNWEVILLVVGMSLIIQSFFVAAMLANLTFTPSIQNIIQTPAGVQEKKIN